MMGIVDFEHIMLDISALALATSGPFLHRASQIYSWKQRENISEKEPTKNKNGCQNKHLTK